MKFHPHLFFCVLFLLTVLGCGRSDGGSSEVKNKEGTSTTSPDIERAKIQLILTKQAQARAEIDAKCKTVLQTTLYNNPIGTISGIPQCAAMIRTSKNPRAIIMACKDYGQIVLDVTKSCLLGDPTVQPNKESAPNYCDYKDPASYCA